VAIWIDQYKRWPGVHSKGVPDFEISIVDDRMFDSISENRFPNVSRVFLVVKLGGMHANDDEVVWKLALQLFQVGNDVHTVDAAECPEVEQHKFSVQLLQRNRMACIEPA